MKAAGKYQTALAEANIAKNAAICGIVIGAILIILMVVIRVESGTMIPIDASLYVYGDTQLTQSRHAQCTSFK